MADLVDTTGLSKKLLGQFMDVLSADQKRYEEQVAAAEQAGFKDRAKRLKKVALFWKNNPEMRALIFERNQNPELFDMMYPQHKNLAFLEPMVEHVYMKGNTADWYKFEANVAAPATTRIRILQELDSDPATYGLNAAARMYKTGPGKEGTLEDLADFAANPKGQTQNFKNEAIYNKEIQALRREYPVKRYGNILAPLQGIHPNVFLANKDEILDPIKKRGKIIDSMSRYQPYLKSHSSWAGPLKQHYRFLEDVLRKSYADSSILDDWSIDHAQTSAANTIKNMQQRAGQLLAKLTRDKKYTGYLKDAFIRNMHEQGIVDPKTAEDLWEKQGKQAVFDNWSAETSDMLAMGNLIEAMTHVSGDEEEDREAIMNALDDHVYHLLSNFAPQLVKNMPRPDISEGDSQFNSFSKYENVKRKQEEDFRNHRANMAFNINFGPQDESEQFSNKNEEINAFPPQFAPVSNRPQETTPPNQLLDSLIVAGYLISPRGQIKQENPEYMPEGIEPKYIEIPINQRRRFLQEFFGNPQAAEQAARSLHGMKLGTSPAKFFSMLPSSYINFCEQTEIAHKALKEADKAITLAKTPEEKEKAVADAQKLETAINARYAELGTDAEEFKQMGSEIITALTKGGKLPNIMQSFTQKYNIPVPSDSYGQQEAPVDPLIEEKRKGIEIDNMGKAAKLAKQQNDDKEEKAEKQKEAQREEKKEAFKQKMDEKEMAIKEKEAETDAQKTTAMTGLETQKTNAQIGVEEQKLEDMKQTNAVKRAQQNLQMTVNDPLVKKLSEWEQSRDALHSALQETPIGKSGEIQDTRWDEASGQHVTRVKAHGTGDIAEFPIDQSLLEQIKFDPAQSKVFLKGEQRASPPPPAQKDQPAPTPQATPTSIRTLGVSTVPKFVPPQPAPADASPPPATPPAPTIKRKGLNFKDLR